MAPAIAVLGPIRREGRHVVGCLANGAQDGPRPWSVGARLASWRGTRQATRRIFGAKETESRAPAARPHADQDVLFLGQRGVNVHRLAASRQTKPSL
jgi:hypothetical protein